MERVAMTAEIREKSGKGIARGLRRNERVPAVLYSHGSSLPISMGLKDIRKILNAEGGEHALINLTLTGAKEAKERMALIKDYQVDPRSGGLIHVDLQEVAMNEKVKIQVTVHLTGSAAGVKEGGILQLAMRELEVECLPAQIPDHFVLDVSALNVNESLHVRDIKAPEGVKILNDPEGTVVTIQPPISAEKLESMLTATPAAATEGEPELVKKPKKEGEAAAAAPAAGETKGKEAPAKEAAAPKKEAAPKK
ncbi:MAG TPA: 50S ribosomal protein L25 [Nitrospirota bacterium]|nr:50S ribosomal protein L25 [Nitrospirota bacterium]